MRKRQILMALCGGKRYTACAAAVAEKLGVKNQVRFLHTIDDVLRAVRRRYKARKVQKLDNADWFVAKAGNHVLLLDSTGQPVVDTDPKYTKNHEFDALYAVYAA